LKDNNIIINSNKNKFIHKIKINKKENKNNYIETDLEDSDNSEK
jgi:hypothetical protein